MAGRLQEGIKTAGLIFSVIVSISTVAFGLFVFYFEHLKTSEAVDASLSTLIPTLDGSSKLESGTIDFLFVNKGDNAVTVSDLRIEMDEGKHNCCRSTPGYKPKEDVVIVPILLPPKQVSTTTVRFSWKQGLPAPWGFRMAKKDDPPREPSPPPPPINVEKMSVTVRLTTIGPSYGRQDVILPIAILYLKDFSLTSYVPLGNPSILVTIRKDPPFFKALLESLIN
jgi:hypothetical protein